MYSLLSVIIVSAIKFFPPEKKNPPLSILWGKQRLWEVKVFVFAASVVGICPASNALPVSLHTQFAS